MTGGAVLVCIMVKTQPLIPELELAAARRFAPLASRSAVDRFDNKADVIQSDLFLIHPENQVNIYQIRREKEEQNTETCGNSVFCKPLTLHAVESDIPARLPVSIPYFRLGISIKCSHKLW